MFSVLNGQRFFRQGTGTPPEFRANGTSADTRAVTEHKCGLGYHKEKSVESLISARRLPTNEPSENKPPVSHHQGPSAYDCPDSGLQTRPGISF